MTQCLGGYIIKAMIKTKKSNGQSGIIKEMRQIGAGIENRLTSKFREMGTGIESRLGKEINQLGIKIESVEHKINLLSENQMGMREKLDATFEMTGKLSEDMTIVKDGLELIKGGLKRKVDVDEFAALERRVAILERKSR